MKYYNYIALLLWAMGLMVLVASAFTGQNAGAIVALLWALPAGSYAGKIISEL